MKDDILQKRFTRYLQKAVHNKRAEYCKRQDRYALEESTDDFSMYHSEDTDFFEQIDLKNALHKLSMRDRKILYLKIFEGQSIREIAVLLNISRAATAKAYQRAIAQVRAELQLEESDDF